MRKSILFFGSMSLILLFGQGCKQHEAAPAISATSQQPAVQEQSAKGINTSVFINNKNAQAILEAYQDLRNGLVQEDALLIKRAALALLEGAKLFPQETVIRENAENILQTNDLQKQRALFSSISNSYIKIIKASGIRTGTLFIAHCPMALDDKGAYWVTEKKDILNPYFGESMLTCGSIKETLQ